MSLYLIHTRACADESRIAIATWPICAPALLFGRQMALLPSHQAIRPIQSIQQRPSAYGPPSQSSVMRLALLPPLATLWSAPMGMILPACLKTPEQVPCDTDYWLRACAAWRITRGPRCGLVLSPSLLLPRAWVSRFRSEAFLVMAV